MLLKLDLFVNAFTISWLELINICVLTKVAVACYDEEI